MRTAIAGAVLVVTLALAACDDGDMIDPSPLPNPAPVGRAIFGVDNANRLIRFSSTNPSQVSRSVAIAPLAGGETIVGIDVRPAGGGLYALSSASRVYVVDTVSGAATPVGAAAFAPVLSGLNHGWDFNPVPDRIRVHGDGGQDLRLNPSTGAVAATDSALMFAVTDPNAAATPRIVGTAYTNSVNPAPTTTVLFAIDANLDMVVRLPNPNDGRLMTVGPLGLNTTGDVGFDIVGTTGEAFASLTPTGATSSSLYRISVSGSAGLIGAIGHSMPLRGIAVVP